MGRRIHTTIGITRVRRAGPGSERNEFSKTGTTKPAAGNGGLFVWI
jgi:hypothetical protein